jgi:hypothetical protein
LPKGEIKGMIIRDFSRLPNNPTKKRYQFTELAIQNNFLVLITCTSQGYPELFMLDEAPQMLDEIIQEVVGKYGVPKDKIFMGGISASGTRALRFVQYCNSGKSKYNTKIAGVFTVDSPLDMERFYRSSKHILQRKAENGMLWEAKLMTGLLDSVCGGSPDEQLASYQNYSVYSYSSPVGGNAALLMSTSLIFYHEPDVDWWLENRSATLLDINSFDIVGLVGQLKHFKHPDVTLISTQKKGYDHKGERHPHSWSIVDEQQLMQWILERSE